MIRLTNSEMKDWRRCKRKWWLGNYRGLQKLGAEEFNKPLSIGTRIHDALQRYYVAGDKRVDPMDFLRAECDADVELHPAQTDAIRKEQELCEAMLEGYFEWLEEEGEDIGLTVVESESEIEVPLVKDVEGEVQATLLSKVDARVDRGDGKRGALEHKTVGSLTDPIRRLQVDTQLLTEHLVEFMMFLEKGEDPEEIRAQFVLYNMLRKVKRTGTAKPPFFDRHEVQHNIGELRKHWVHVSAQATEILEARAKLDLGYDPHEVCYPNPTGDCTWDCPFREPCLAGMFDDGSDVEGYLADQFETGDPLERYRKQVGLSANPAAEKAESST